MAVGLASGAAFLVARPDLVLVEHLEFVGADHADERALRHLADLQNGTSWWLADTEAVRRGVERHPWVRSATVERVWPDTLRVTVDERVPVALLAMDRTYVLDEDGVPFLVADGRELDLPLILGLDPDLEARHPELPRLVLRDALWLVREIPARTGVAAESISSVTFSRGTGMSVSVGRSRVIFGLEGLSRQMDRLERLVRDSAVALDRPLLIDLAPATVAIVRPLEPENAG
jgi:cell division protein FtsQ